MNLDEALHTFIEESRELLSEMEDSLLRVEQEAEPETCINAIFRAAHTIKGSAGLFGLDTIVAFTHVAESLLDEVRAGSIPLSQSLVQLLLNCCDHMHALVNAVEEKSSLEAPALKEYGLSLIQALEAYRQAPPTHHALAHVIDSSVIEAAPPENELTEWHIAVRFAPSVLQNGMDPLSFVRYLHTLGEVFFTETLLDQLPSLPELDAEMCYLGFTLHIRTTSSREELESVFEFVRDDCSLCITHLHDTSRSTTLEDSPWQALQCTPCNDCPECTNSCTQNSSSANTQVTDYRTLLTCPVANLTPATPPVQATAAPLNKVRTGNDVQASVRVDAHKLDQLINLVGELIIASAGATEVARKLRHSDMVEATAAVSTLVQEVRDQALQLRMVKIGGTFNKFQRVVHDVARELGKDIVLQVSGEDTELDKTVVERIGDPLTHLVRNAMDHGIESSELRLARGKPAQGTVSLNAYHESGHIVIEISDDGGGLDRERILAKGIERDLVEAGRQLSDKEIFNLIFEPGFSTASQITNLSGRGVGMDVVRSNITALRGTVELDSHAGEGTTVQVRLPLTLAIINGFQVRVGNAVFVIPLDMVDECIEHKPQTPDTAQHYTDLRGSVLPFVALRQHFELQGPASTRPNIVVIKHGNHRFGLLVDELLGEAQTVIKPLSRLFSQAQGISGSSILGNGNVALILDIPVLHQQLLTSSSDLNTPSHSVAP